MDTERLRQIEAVFDTAVQLSAEDRPEYLAQACANDDELKAEVESLLAVDGHSAQFLSAGIQREAESLSVRVSGTVVGRRIGLYRLTKVLGRGGMGSVYLAVREDDVYEKPVALKVIKRGMDTDEIVHRFRRERRILSRLDHPNIARLLDGGTTDDGLPYLVMEYIDGTPLLEFARGVDINARLELFRSICSGVEYAHRNLVVHRDLKPGNILVTAPQNGQSSVAKLLDFGIAKLLSGDDTSQTIPELRILTPDYASPEQKVGKGVTTATDIYSLGRILEELVRDVASPSELKQVIVKARHEDPDRRYATVAELAEDVRLYLGGFAIRARGDSPLYQARKFLRRNRWTVLAATIAAISLVAGTVVSTIQARRAQRRFDVAHGFANLVVMDISRQLQRTPGALSVAQTLIGKTVEMLDSLAKDAGQDRALLYDLGVGYFRVASLQFAFDGPNLGEYEGCLENAGKARAILEPLLARDPGSRHLQHQVGQVYKQLSWCHAGVGDYEEAIQWARKSGPLFEQSDPYPESGYSSNLHLTTKSDIAGALVALGRCSEALKLYDKQSEPRGLPSRLTIGTALTCLGDLAGAEKQFAGSANDALVFAYGELLGNPLLLNLGRWEDGLRLVRQSLSGRKQAADRDPNDMFAKVVLALRYRSLGAFLRESDPVEAVSAYDNALALQAAWVSRSPRNRPGRLALARTHAEIALPLRKVGRLDDARSHLTKAAEIESGLKERRGFTEIEWGDHWLGAGDAAKAEEHYREAIELLQAEIARRPEPMLPRRELADAYERLGGMFARSGDKDQAQACYRKGLDIWRNWTTWGVSSAYNERREKEAAALLSKHSAIR